MGFFGNISSDFNIHKKDFLEKALCYVNQAYVSTKDGEIIIYCQYVILGQVIPFRNPPEELDEYISSEDHLVKMYVPLYDNNDGRFLGVKFYLFILFIIFISSWNKIVKSTNKNQPSTRYNYSFHATVRTKENVRLDIISSTVKTTACIYWIPIHTIQLKFYYK